MTQMSDASHLHRTSLAAAWAEALGTAPGAFDVEPRTLVRRDDLDAVIVVELGDAMVVAAPSAALAALAALDRAALLDATALAAALPGSRPLGSAHLLIAEARPPDPAHPVDAADDRDVRLVRESVAEDEWDESGVEPMELRWSVRLDGRPVAIAGFEPWRSRLAHIGVVAASAERGRGFAASAATGAVLAALDAGLVPQWRCRVGHTASLRLAERLGFARAGTQAAVALPA
ncbi:GNAT family N-acetyltransferase [Agrococcus sp. TF02-05]|uniref:GNAT family N-acetyltransferase n=1 Tax=Agrococcus sp. TF02-05 TaxID=2815211 RepID=UPI001AA12F09|nr:GNAT family N-acetyltransferase [Agrococcus sp. TF02-05]MBO1770260.1 GNAT family N-acetyltransferase [Agrococcus sp. TF02-05]